jgi:hypothetical protein
VFDTRKSIIALANHIEKKWMDAIAACAELNDDYRSYDYTEEDGTSGLEEWALAMYDLEQVADVLNDYLGSVDAYLNGGIYLFNA